MPVLKFETKLVNGKPKIVYETEKSDIPAKKFSYKTKAMKYPIRSKTQKDGDEINNENKPSKPLINNNESKKPSQKSVQSKQPIESIFNLANEIEEPKLKNTKTNNKTILSDNEIDEIMQRVIMDNKDVLTEEQLVDLLAKLYLEANHYNVDTKIKKKDVKKDNDIEETIKNNSGNFNPSKLKQLDLSSLNNEKTDEIKDDKPVVTLRKLPVPLTMAEKKRIQWELERKEIEKLSDYNPWGKPGCGAPTRNSYEFSRSDSDRVKNENYPEIIKEKNQHGNKGIGGPELYIDKLNEQNQLSKEEKRKQWLRELDEQVAERERARKTVSNSDTNNGKMELNYTSGQNVSPGRMSDMGTVFERGRGLADLKQQTTEEAIIKRNKQLEQKEAIRQQIEEKEQMKLLEKERKARLDLEEEMKMLKEKQTVEKKFTVETSRAKEKEDEYGRKFQQQRAQLEAAEKAAMLDKKLKRLQKLEMGGHDTRRLRAELAAEQLAEVTTYRDTDLKSFMKSPELLERSLNQTYYPYNQQEAVKTTPRFFNKIAITEDQAVQTDVGTNSNNSYYKRVNDDIDNEDMFGNKERYNNRHRMKKQRSAEESSRQRKQIARPRTPSSASSWRNNKRKQREQPKSQVKKRIKKPEPIDKRPPWGCKKISKKYVPQSKRDPFYEDEKDSREAQKQERVNKILNQVRANIDRIPECADPINSDRNHRIHCDFERETLRESARDESSKKIQDGTYDLRHSTERKERHEILLNNDEDIRQKSQKIISTRRQEKPETKNTSPTHRRKNQGQYASLDDPEEWFYDDVNHPIVRTTDILDPALADDELPFSRENTGREKARRGYFKGMNPIEYGKSLENKTYNISNSKSTEKHDTLYRQQGYPSERQNTILQQLSDIREGLRLKQKEIETSLSYDHENE